MSKSKIYKHINGNYYMLLKNISGNMNVFAEIKIRVMATPKKMIMLKELTNENLVFFDIDELTEINENNMFLINT